MSFTTMYETLLDGGKPRAGVPVVVQLVAAVPGEGAGYTTAGTIIGEQRTTTRSNGRWELEVTPNSEISPDGTGYRVIVPGARSTVVRYFIAPVSIDPVTVEDCRVTDLVIVDVIDGGGPAPAQSNEIDGGPP